MYLGSARILNHRWTEHRSALQQNKHHSRYLQRAFNKEPDAFYVEVIEEMNSPSKEELLGREQFWLDFYRPFERTHGYNVCPKAASCQGIKRAPEMIAKIAATLSGRKFSAQRLEIHRNRKRTTKFRTFTPAQKQEQSLRFKGRKITIETRAKMSAALRANPPHQRPVLQFDLNGHLLARHRTILEAEASVGKNRCGVAEACNGKVTHCKGFQWRYEDDLSGVAKMGKQPQRRYRGVPVSQFAMDGSLIAVHTSFLQASKTTGIKECSIRAAATRENNISFGFRWVRTGKEGHA